MKSAIQKFLPDFRWDDLGPPDVSRVDYPDFAEKLAKKIASNEAERGILICGSGIGMCIAANKVHGIRAALAWNEETAALARRHNDANVLSVPARMISPDEVSKVVKSYLEAKFEGGRHQRRVEEISEMEKQS